MPESIAEDTDGGASEEKSFVDLKNKFVEKFLKGTLKKKTVEGFLKKCLKKFLKEC